MQIDIPQSDAERLVRHAAAAGYDDVERYITEHVLALAQEPTPDELLPLGAEELAASLDLCDRSMAEIEAGHGLTVSQARQQTLDSLRQKPQ